jgi:hypothetical protein
LSRCVSKNRRTALGLDQASPSKTATTVRAFTPLEGHLYACVSATR